MPFTMIHGGDMNERIYELAIEAEMIVGEGNGFDMTRMMPREVKFAELIVRECVSIIDAIPTSPQGAWSDGYYEGCRDSAKAIQEHFGFE